MENKKLYTEDEVKKAIELAREHYMDWLGYEQQNYEEDEIIAKLTPIEIPSDEEIYNEAQIQYPVNLQPNGRTLAGGIYNVDINYSERIVFTQCAKWMRDKIQGGNN